MPEVFAPRDEVHAMVLQGHFSGSTAAAVELEICSCRTYCIAGYMPRIARNSKERSQTCRIFNLVCERERGGGGAGQQFRHLCAAGQGGDPRCTCATFWLADSLHVFFLEFITWRRKMFRSDLI